MSMRSLRLVEVAFGQLIMEEASTKEKFCISQLEVVAGTTPPRTKEMLIADVAQLKERLENMTVRNEELHGMRPRPNFHGKTRGKAERKE